MFIHVEQKSIIQGQQYPWRGAFTVHIGQPIRFKPGTAYADATQRIEAAVLALEAAALAGASPTRESARLRVDR
jgi:hypothetical protein